MTSTGFLFIIIAVFVLFNTANIVGVIQGNKTFGSVKPAKS